MKKTQYYSTLTDDFFDDGQPHPLPQGYQWVRTGLRARLASSLVYGAAVVFGTFYCRLGLHFRIKGAKKLRKCNSGFFLYGNHTQPVGDVVIPALACFPKRIYTVASPANLDLPVLGRALPYLGALPIEPSIRGMKELSGAIATRISQGHPVVIYPEAHVWPYYTGIRPFPATSFKFPEKLGAPVYAMTATYQKRRFGKKPKLTLYIDGPFRPEGEGPKARAEHLRQQVAAAMDRRAAESNCEYIPYRQK